MRNNEKFYLSPRTKLLRKHGTEVACGTITGPIFEIDGRWIQFTPKPIHVQAPEIIRPNTKPTWHYVSLEDIPEGIYMEADLQNYLDSISQPHEKAAAIHVIGRAATGRNFSNQGIYIGNTLINNDTLETIALETGKKIWGWFSGFGMTSAGLIGIYLTFRLRKIAIDTIIHVIALHSLYGWSYVLIASLWDSVTHLMLHLGRSAPTPEAVEQEEYIGLNERSQSHPPPSTPPPEVPKRNAPSNT